MVEDTKYFHGVAADPVHYPMAIADQAAKAASPCRFCFATARMLGKSLECTFDVSLVGIGSNGAELGFPIFADLHQIGARRPA